MAITKIKVNGIEHYIELDGVKITNSAFTIDKTDIVLGQNTITNNGLRTDGGVLIGTCKSVNDTNIYKVNIGTGVNINSGVTIEPNVSIGSTTIQYSEYGNYNVCIGGEVKIGTKVKIGSGVTIEPNVSIGSTTIQYSEYDKYNVCIGDDVKIGSKVDIGSEVNIGSSVDICSEVDIGSGVTLVSNVHILPGVNIGGEVKIGSGVYVGSGVTIESNLKLDSSTIGNGGAVTYDSQNPYHNMGGFVFKIPENTEYANETVIGTGIKLSYDVTGNRFILSNPNKTIYLT